MTAYEKPEIDLPAVQQLLEHCYGHKVDDVKPLSGGNLSAVFAFNEGGRGLVIRFSDLEGAFETERYISGLLSAQGVPYPRMVRQGKFENLKYTISVRVEGQMVADMPVDRRRILLPDLVQVITRMNHVQLGLTSGYGWINAYGEGMYASWAHYLKSFYQEDQTGNFWEGWTDLFHSTFLEKAVFDECYARLLDFAKYNAPHRYFVHGDCHAWNILSDGRTITGIIDGNCVYGDFLIDVSIVEGVMPGEDVVGSIREHQEKHGIEIPHFNERMIGARYYKGLDGLRFYAKMGRKHDYDELRDFLLNLTH